MKYLTLLLAFFFLACAPSPKKIVENYIKAYNAYDTLLMSQLLTDTLRIDANNQSPKKSFINFFDTLKYLEKKIENFEIVSLNDSVVKVICNNNLFLDYLFKTENKSIDTIFFTIKDNHIKSVITSSKVDNNKEEIFNKNFKLLITYALSKDNKILLANIKKHAEAFCLIPEDDRFRFANENAIKGHKFSGRYNGISVIFHFKENGQVYMYWDMMLQSVDEWKIKNNKLIFEGAFEIPFEIGEYGNSLRCTQLFEGTYYKQI